MVTIGGDGNLHQDKPTLAQNTVFIDKICWNNVTTVEILYMYGSKDNTDKVKQQ